MIDVSDSCPSHNSKSCWFRVLVTERFFHLTQSEILFTYFLSLAFSLTGVLISTASFPVLKGNRIFDGGAAGIEITNSAGESSLLTNFIYIARVSAANE